jgi:large subunit ribosomal protein L18
MTKIAKKKREDRLRRHARVRAVVSGSAERPRLNVFRSEANIYAQVIDDVAGHTLASASTIDKEVARLIEGKTKSESAKIVGSVIAQRAKAAGISKVVFDRGGYRYFGRISALADGAREGGLEF